MPPNPFQLLGGLNWIFLVFKQPWCMMESIPIGEKSDGAGNPQKWLIGVGTDGMIALLDGCPTESN